MLNYLELLLIIMLVCSSSSAYYYKGKYEGASENNEDLVEEIRYLHLIIDEETYETFYKDL